MCENSNENVRQIYARKRMTDKENVGQISCSRKKVKERNYE